MSARCWLVLLGTLVLSACGGAEDREAVEAIGEFRDRLADGSPGPAMVVLPPGSFEMGTENGTNYEKPVHTVRFDRPVVIGKHEVCFEDYERFARAAGRPVPEAPWGRGRQPVVNVLWQDAVDYAAWLSEQTGRRYRLPSEAEWEYAARAGTATRFWWGDILTHELANAVSPDGGPMPVDSMRPNPFGLHHTAGNVAEWTMDCWSQDYRDAPADGSVHTTTECLGHVIRGGAWMNNAYAARATNRYWYRPHLRFPFLGFRLAADDTNKLGQTHHPLTTGREPDSQSARPE